MEESELFFNELSKLLKISENLKQSNLKIKNSTLNKPEIEKHLILAERNCNEAIEELYKLA